jgi:hypothetical protein
MFTPGGLSPHQFTPMSGASGGATNRGQPVGSETNRTPAAVGLYVRCETIAGDGT